MASTTRDTVLQQQSITVATGLQQSVAEQLLREVQQVYAERGTLTDEVLTALNFMFQAPLQQALDLTDHGSVAQLTSPSDRWLYQVLGSAGTPYICPAMCNFCSCPAFRFSVLKKSEYQYCKHLLAVRLGQAMGRLEQRSVSDQELSTMLRMLD